MAILALPTVSHAQDGEGGAATTGDPDADALIAEIERVHAQMVEAREQLRSDRLDPDALLDTIGRDPDAILDWVTDETRWLPYEGQLRGARGVLMDRSGSSLDRALLLADLLERAGLEVRLANATLPTALASSLASAALDDTGSLDSEPAFATAEDVEAYRAGVGSAAAQLAAQVGLLDGPGATEPDPAAVIADHWWVQASADGQWVDYDPLFAAGANERPPAERTVDHTDVPEELRHAVRVRIVIERLEDGALIEEIPLEHTVLLGAGAPDTSMGLDFAVWVPPELSEQAELTTDVLEGARMSASWQPRLRVDGQTERGEWFSEAGRLGSPSAPAQADALAGGLEALGGIGSEPAEPDGGEASLTAAWIEYETRGPGVEPRVERRELLDLVAASREDAGAIDAWALSDDEADLRRGLAFLGESEILLNAAATHPDAVLDAYLETWIELRPALIALAFVGAGVDDERIEPSLAAPETRPVGLLAMTSARADWATSPAIYVDRPQVWSQHAFFEPGPEVTASSHATDIVMNDAGVQPGAGADPRLVRLEQGILDTLVEHVLGGSPESLNTWDRFAQREDGATDWVVLSPAADLEAEALEALPPADLARIRAALTRGDSVVVATEPRLRGGVAFADWWRIAQDGSALGMGYRGWGQDTTEEATVTQPSMRALELAKDSERVEQRLEEIRQIARAARARGQYDPYAHLRDRLAVNPFAETQPIIEALAGTLPFLYSMGG